MHKKNAHFTIARTNTKSTRNKKNVYLIICPAGEKLEKKKAEKESDISGFIFLPEN